MYQFDVRCVIISLSGIVLMAILLFYHRFIAISIMFLFAFICGFISNNSEARVVVINVFAVYLIMFTIGGIIAVILDLGISPDIILGIAAGILEGIVLGIFAGILASLGIKLKNSI